MLNLDHNFSNNNVLSTQNMIASLKSSSSFKNSWNDVFGRDDNDESTTGRKGPGLPRKGRRGGRWVHRIRNQSCTKTKFKNIIMMCNNIDF